MPLDEILQSMESEASEERARILTESRAECERILAEARAEAEASRARRLDLERQLARTERARLENDARLAGLRALALARERLVEDAFAQAEAELEQLRGGASYPAVLRLLLVEAVAEVGVRPLVAEVDPRDADLLRALAAAAGLEVEVETTLHSAGGLVARDRAGAVVVRNTFEARLRSARQALRGEIAAAIELEPQVSAPSQRLTVDRLAVEADSPG